MIKSQKYKLAEYKIIENEDGYTWWEAHSGFCSVKMGCCFVQGNILFIAPEQTSEDNGFLKGDYLDELNRLPRWEKTTFYCTAFNIVSCKIGRKIKYPLANRKISQRTIQEAVSCRLRQFEIIEKKDGKIIWKSFNGLKTIKEGKAFLHGNILFLGPKKSEKTDMTKKVFFERLLLLPLWKKTNYFCRQYNLYSCSTNIICYDLDEDIPTTKSENNTVISTNKSPKVELNIKPQTLAETFKQKHLKEIFPFCTKVVLIILKVLFWLIRIVYKAIKLFIEKCVLFSTQLKKWVWKILKGP